MNDGKCRAGTITCLVRYEGGAGRRGAEGVKDGDRMGQTTVMGGRVWYQGVANHSG